MFFVGKDERKMTAVAAPQTGLLICFIDGLEFSESKSTHESQNNAEEYSRKAPESLEKSGKYETINNCSYYFKESTGGSFKETTDTTETDKASTSKPEEDNLKIDGRIVKHL